MSKSVLKIGISVMVLAFFVTGMYFFVPIFVSASDPGAGEIQRPTSAVGNSTLGTKKVLVLLADFADRNKAIDPGIPSVRVPTPQEIRESIVRVAQYYSEVSYGQVNMSDITVLGWYQLPLPYSGCPTVHSDAGIRDAVRAAADPEVFFPNYPVQIIISTCHPHTLNTGGSGDVFSPEDGWYHLEAGTYISLSNATNAKVHWHEIAHGFVGHPEHDIFLSCVNSTVPFDITYGDKTANCSISSNGIFGVFHGGGHMVPSMKQEAGWINDQDMRNVAWAELADKNEHLYTISSVELPTATAQFLKFPLGFLSGNGVVSQDDLRDIWLEYRRPIGENATLPAVLGASDVLDGLILYINGKTLLDANPLPSASSPDIDNQKNARLGIGQVFSEPSSGVQVRPITMNDASITFGLRGMCVENPPFSPRQLSPFLGWGYPGAAFQFTWGIINRDTAFCDKNPVRFNLQNSGPEGFSVRYSSLTGTSVALLSQEKTELAIEVQAPLCVAPGVYDFSMNAVRTDKIDASRFTSSSIGQFAVGSECHTSPNILPGDMNVDGKITPADGQTVLSIAQGNISCPCGLSVADVDKDGSVTKIDAQIVFDRFISADTTAPTVSMTSPTNGTTISGIIPVSATASDNIAVRGVQFWILGPTGSTFPLTRLDAEDFLAPYTIDWNTATGANGSYSIIAVARDTTGNRATSTSVSVTVQNIVPIKNIVPLEQSIVPISLPPPQVPPPPRQPPVALVSSSTISVFTSRVSVGSDDAEQNLKTG
ncbi:MAG: fibronectin type III domain-containing protein, partial [Parcubacteria group bacterium Greene0714_4]